MWAMRLHGEWAFVTGFPPPPGCLMLRRFRGHPDLFSLHCLIWTMQPNFAVRRFAAYADMCRDCVADKVCIVKLDDGNEERLPMNVLRNILLYVGFASSH